MMVGAGSYERFHLLDRFDKNEYIKPKYAPTHAECKKNIHLNVDKTSFDKYTDPTNLTEYNDDTDIVEVNINSPTIREQTMGLLELSLAYNDIILICFREFREYALTFIKDMMKYRNMSRYKHKAFILVRIKRDESDTKNEIDNKHKNELEQLIKDEKLPYVETHIESGKNINLLFRLSVYEYWLQSQI